MWNASDAYVFGGKSDPVLGYAAGTLIVLTLVVLGVGLLGYAVYFFFIKKW